jgi:sterol 3beta-glucosyltransferase
VENRRRITLVTSGTRGDVQPAIALGLGLQQAGYQARLVAFKEFGELVTGYGLEFYPLKVDMQGLFARYGKTELFDAGKSNLRWIPELIRVFKGMYDQMTGDFLEACQDAVAVVGETSCSILARSVAEKVGAVYIESAVLPVDPTRSFPSILWPHASSPCTGHGLRGRYNRMTWDLVGFLSVLGMRPIINRSRTKILGMAPTHWGRLDNLSNTPVTTLCGFSQHVLPRPMDWGANIHVTGWWFVAAPSYQPPPELETFLAAGPKPVYIGFGSMPSKHPMALADLVVEALWLAGQRGVLYTAPGVLGQGMVYPDGNKNIFVSGSIPHDWLFPHMAAVVHHGGSGTTGAGINAGVPSILVPVMGDQFLWAQRIEELGLGPKPIPRAKLTAERLAVAIRLALGSREMQQHSSEMAQRVQSEEGVERAVEIIIQLLQRSD